MACYLTEPSHYITANVDLISVTSSFPRGISAINHWDNLENYLSKISFQFLGGQSVNTGAYSQYIPSSLQWRHNERDGFSNHQHQDCLLNRLFRCRLKKTSKLRVTGLYGEFTGHQWIPRTNCKLRGKCFHLMTSSCSSRILALWIPANAVHNKNVVSALFRRCIDVMATFLWGTLFAEVLAHSTKLNGHQDVLSFSE